MMLKRIVLAVGLILGASAAAHARTSAEIAAAAAADPKSVAGISRAEFAQLLKAREDAKDDPQTFKCYMGLIHASRVILFGTQKEVTPVMAAFLPKACSDVRPAGTMP